MGETIFFFILILIVLSVFTRETFLLVLLYLFVGAMILGRWWSQRVITRFEFARGYDHKVFPGESVPIHLDLHNGSLLPVVWLRVQDFYPIEVADAPTFSQVVSMGPREKSRLTYSLKAHKRGYYTIGPLYLTTGDLLGMSAERSSEGGLDHLIVYPRVLPLTEIRLPSRSPMGTMRHKQPVFEDPTRSIGKRDYQPGDSLRRIDWKATATTGRMQTKLFEPSIALETTIFLNLNVEDYHIRTRFDASELAIIVAASLANWVISKRQSAGLIINGIDPLSADSKPVPLPARKGRAHLMRILEGLARVKTAETDAFETVLRQHRVHLPWGTTTVIITGAVNDALFDELLQSRRAGLNPVLISCGEHPNHRQVTQWGKMFEIPVYTFRDEKDLDIWRK